MTMSLLQEDDAKVKKAFQTMLTYIGNVAQNPNEEKYRKIRLTNATFQVSSATSSPLDNFRLLWCVCMVQVHFARNHPQSRVQRRSDCVPLFTGKSWELARWSGVLAALRVSER